LLATCETVAVEGFPGISKLLNPKGYLLLPYPLKKLIQQAPITSPSLPHSLTPSLPPSLLSPHAQFLKIGVLAQQ
ncbi:MAG: hypothetical protein MJK14_06800, partial [Rivularia sp. ALOHA_DT_140]|nr:hypothetical protein [Rivularia sp. ALOHA_DT_140]